jgi:uncharacterized protein DUF29
MAWWRAGKARVCKHRSMAEKDATVLYDEDFFQWTSRNARLLRQGRIAEADIEHIAEEIEDMGKDRRNALKGQLRRALLHLLKYQFQPSRRGAGWLKSIISSRIEIQDLLDENPSLKPLLEDLVAAAYPGARRLAAIETGLPIKSFPARCPYSVKQIRSDGFLPG